MDTFISSKRGKFLTIVLFLLSINLISALLKLNDTSFWPKEFGISPINLNIIFLIIELILLWEIWLWKKWAVFGKFVFDVISKFIYILAVWVRTNNSLSDVINFMLLGLASIIIIDGLLFWAVKRRWKHFS